MPKGKVVTNQTFSPFSRSWSEMATMGQAEIADAIEAIDADIRECFANTRNMVRGYGF